MTKSCSLAPLLLGIMLAGTASVIACEAETGPDAPPRKNGCIDWGCAPPVDRDTKDAGEDAGS